MIEIETCSTDADYRKALAVTRAYTDWLGVDLGFQDIDRELANFNQVYAPPRGFYLLAREGVEVAGGVGLRVLGPDSDIAEMKRLYVYDEFKGKGVGEQLCRVLLDRARGLGYERVRLDTLPVMGSAHKLYEKLGFSAIEPYRHTPVSGAEYLECDLRGA